MKANEVRIGNYYYHHIVDMLDDRKEWDEICQIDYDDFRILTESDCPEYKPIPLAEEWLKRFGFKKHYSGTRKWQLDKESKFYIIKIKNRYLAKLKLYKTDGIILRKIDYVHQLQNLYFTLKDEELIQK